ncbi:MAG: beta-ketoacyl-[acyl-carrier-protein] synthase II [Chloroflexi bacterium]|nr:beta-ketoacyl-[acyl-carrier-protein] synthase II [Chloroflexota bacterium]
MSNRVFVTGLGAITPVGLNIVDTWESLISGKSGIGKITSFDAENYKTQIAAEITDFEPADYIEKKQIRRLDRFVQLSIGAALQAVDHSKLEINQSNSARIGVMIASGIGGIITISNQLEVLAEKGPNRVSPFFVPMMLPDMASGQVSMTIGARGPSIATVSACASGADSIGAAFNQLQADDLDIIIAGGTEASICPIGIAGFNACHALSTNNENPEQASRPFDAERDGFVCGEGSGVLVLETLKSMEKRSVEPIAELVGYGASADAHHVTQPAPGGEGGARAMKSALKRANIVPDEIDYINAHGTSTPLNDKYETLAMKAVFEEHAYKVPISSTKSMTGHLLGASGALEAVVSVLAIKNNIVPPTINLQNADPECDLNYTPNKAKETDVNSVISNSFGFGGHNSSLVFKGVDR